MRTLSLLCLLLIPVISVAQSKSINRFRSAFKENSNVFFYSSTLKMLNPDNDPELSEILDDIEEIRVLNYTRTEQKFDREDIIGLKNALQKEEYNNIMMLSEQGNSINLYSREKRGKTYGFVAVVENAENLILIDLVGSINIKKFMELKHKIDHKTQSLS